MKASQCLCLAGAGVLVLGLVVTVSDYVRASSLEDEIRTKLIAGEVPEFDNSTYSNEDISRAYINVAKDSGVNFTNALKNKDYNLYRLIRTAEKRKGTQVATSSNPRAESANRIEEYTED